MSSKSVEKRVRQNERRRLRNAAVKSTVKTGVKKVREAKDAISAKQALQRVCSLVDRAVRKGVLHKNTASRYKSRLTRMVNIKFG